MPFSRHVPLEERFPNCAFAVQLSEYLAGDAQELTVCQQLEKQRVEMILLHGIKVPGILGYFAHEDQYAIQLRQGDSPLELMKSIGHELAHTLEGVDRFKSFLSLLPSGVSDIQMLEDLCEEFAERWIELPTVQKSVGEVLEKLSAEGKIRFNVPPLET